MNEFIICPGTVVFTTNSIGSSAISLSLVVDLISNVQYVCRYAIKNSNKITWGYYFNVSV